MRYEESVRPRPTRIPRSCAIEPSRRQRERRTPSTTPAKRPSGFADVDAPAHVVDGARRRREKAIGPFTSARADSPRRWPSVMPTTTRRPSRGHDDERQSTEPTAQARGALRATAPRRAQAIHYEESARPRPTRLCPLASLRASSTPRHGDEDAGSPSSHRTSSSPELCTTKNRRDPEQLVFRPLARLNRRAGNASGAAHHPRHPPKPIGLR
jgi:hypothetical protein